MKLTETRDGTIVEIYVKPNQPEFKVTVDDDEVLVFSTEEPVKGKVNREIVKGLSRIFHANVEIMSGSTSKQKKVIIKGLTRFETERLLHECV